MHATMFFVEQMVRNRKLFAERGLVHGKAELILWNKLSLLGWVRFHTIQTNPLDMCLSCVQDNNEQMVYMGCKTATNPWVKQMFWMDHITQKILISCSDLHLSYLIFPWIIAIMHCTLSVGLNCISVTMQKLKIIYDFHFSKGRRVLHSSET